MDQIWSPVVQFLTLNNFSICLYHDKHLRFYYSVRQIPFFGKCSKKATEYFLKFPFLFESTGRIVLLKFPFYLKVQSEYFLKFPFLFESTGRIVLLKFPFLFESTILPVLPNKKGNLRKYSVAFL